LTCSIWRSISSRSLAAMAFGSTSFCFRPSKFCITVVTMPPVTHRGAHGFLTLIHPAGRLVQANRSAHDWVNLTYVPLSCYHKPPALEAPCRILFRCAPLSDVQERGVNDLGIDATILHRLEACACCIRRRAAFQDQRMGGQWSISYSRLVLLPIGSDYDTQHP